MCSEPVYQKHVHVGIAMVFDARAITSHSFPRLFFQGEERKKRKEEEIFPLFKDQHYELD